MRRSPVLLISTKVADKNQYCVQYDFWTLFPVLALAVLLPLGVGFLVTTDCHMRLLRKLRLTE